MLFEEYFFEKCSGQRLWLLPGVFDIFSPMPVCLCGVVLQLPMSSFYTSLSSVINRRCSPTGLDLSRPDYLWNSNY